MSCCIPFSAYKIKKINLTLQRLKGEIHFYPRLVLEKNYCDQDMTGSYLAHSNLPPNRSMSRSKYAFAAHLSIIELGSPASTHWIFLILFNCA